jgi:hypothetical protein
MITPGCVVTKPSPLPDDRNTPLLVHYVGRQQGMGQLVTVPGHIRRRWLARVDFERALVLIGAIGVLATVAVLLWGQV